MNDKIKTAKEGVVLLKEVESGVPIALIYKDMVTRKNVFYACKEMDMVEIEDLFNKK